MLQTAEAGRRPRRAATRLEEQQSRAWLLRVEVSMMICERPVTID